MNKRLLVMAGGTGGHVFPGLAVADYLSQQGWDIHWLGTPTRMEASLVPARGYPISFIDVAGLRGNGVKGWLKAPFTLLNALAQARRVLKNFRPNVVLGMGGFASGPGGVAAWLARTPLVLHEQNAVPGLTNKLLAKIARVVLCGFNHTFSAQARQPAKYQWVGNPVREAIVNLAADNQPRSGKNVLVLGGSLGAKALNENVPKALLEIPDIKVRHQCGAGHAESVSQTYQQLMSESQNWQVDAFIDDMPAAYNWADLIICRAGALTVAEVAAAGKPAIFIPLPHAVDDHQTKNALTLVDAGAAYLLPQTQLNDGGLRAILNTIYQSPETLITQGQKARTLAKPDATEQVARIIQQLAHDGGAA